MTVKSGNTNWRERLSTVDLLVLISLDQLLLKLKTLLSCKKSYPNEEVNCTEPSPSDSIPWLSTNIRFRMFRRKFYQFWISEAFLSAIQCDQKIKKICPIFQKSSQNNCPAKKCLHQSSIWKSKTCQTNSSWKLKVPTTNHVWKLLI